MSTNRNLVHVSLPSELKAFIDGSVKGGLYKTAGEVVRTALRKMILQEDLRELQLEDLRREIQKGCDDIKNGRGDTVDNVRASLRAKRTNTRAEFGNAIKLDYVIDEIMGT